MTSLEQAKEIVKVMDKMKAKDIRLINIHEISSLGDYFAIASASNTTQVKAIADEIGGTTLLLHSCHNVSLEDFNNGATYVSLMQQNVINLKTGLGEE